MLERVVKFLLMDVRDLFRREEGVSYGKDDVLLQAEREADRVMQLYNALRSSSAFDPLTSKYVDTHRILRERLEEKRKQLGIEARYRVSVPANLR